LWLPERLSRPVVVDGLPEPIPVWQTRVGVEILASDLLDKDTGWVDVLFQATGLDVDDEQDMTRVQAWLDGAPDAGLDGVEGLVAAEWLPADEENPDWVLGAALELATAWTDEGEAREGPLWLAGVGALAGGVTELCDDPEVLPQWLATLALSIPVWVDSERDQLEQAWSAAEQGDQAGARTLIDGLRPVLLRVSQVGAENFTDVEQILDGLVGGITDGR
jgi:hypothetical protein